MTTDKDPTRGGETRRKAPDDDEDSPYDLFVLAIKSPATRAKYIHNMITFLDKCSIAPGQPIEERMAFTVHKAREDFDWMSRKFRDYCILSRDRIEQKELRPGSVWNVISAVRLFFSVNDFDVAKWKKYTRGIPFGRKAADDSIPSREQVLQMASYPDRRIKMVVFCMASGGWRLGAWQDLQWGHIRPIFMDADGDGEDELVAAKVTIYPGEDETYYTFITPEAYLVTKEWMDFRERCGEKIDRDSWVLRDLWNQRVDGRVNEIRSNHAGAAVDKPKKLRTHGLSGLIRNAWIAQGIRGRLPAGKRRHEFALAHVFRKYFKTTAEAAGMKSINVETLIGHSIGVSDSYYRPREDELLKDYLKAVPALTFEKMAISVQQLQELKQKEVVNTDAIASIVEEMEKQKQEIEALRLENERLKSTGGGKAPSMLDQMAAMQKQLAEMMKKQQEQEGRGGGG